MADVFVGEAVGGVDLNTEDARKALAVLACDPSAYFQLQHIPSGRHVVLAGRDQDALLAAASNLSGGKCLYFGINPVRADLDSPACLPDITRRLWFMVDVDATREDTKNPSSDAEHEAARLVASSVIADMQGQGWPAPVILDSGNGWHLLYRVDLPNDIATRSIIKAALKVLSVAYGDAPGGHVDPNTHKANQHTKLPGSMAKKGNNTPDRPWRRVRLHHVPDRLDLLTLEQISEVAGLDAGQSASPVPPPDGHRLPTRDVFSAFIGTGREEAYARRGLDCEVARVVMARPGPEEGRNNALNRAAFSVGQLVGAKLLDRAEAEGALLRAAVVAGLSEREAAPVVKRALDAGEKQPRTIPERNGVHTDAAPIATAEQLACPQLQPPKNKPQKASQQRQESKRPTIYLLTDLLAMDLPAPSWAVPGLMSEGLTILAGKPKLGKSWLSLNLALTIAAGGKALGSTAVLPGDVLYLSLEDRLRRVKDRASKVLKGLDIEASHRLHIATEWPRLDAGGLDEIGIWCESVSRPALIIVDVWARFRPVYKQGNQYDQDYQAAGSLKMIADMHHTSVLAVHHCKKGKAEDAVEEISGTLGLSGAADGVMILTRARSENEATLFLTGRDIEEQEMALLFTPEHCTWENKGSAAEQTESKFKASLIAVFKANAGCSLTTADLASRIECHKDRMPYLRTVLYRMSQSAPGKPALIDGANGRWIWPTRDAETF